MKKFLAILLAVIMAFSVGIAAFAEGEEDNNTGILLPDFPTQTEGRIYFATENIYVEAGQSYDIPVYIVSNYTPSIDGYVQMGLTISVAGAAADYMTITGMDIANGAKSLDGYVEIANKVALWGDPSYNVFAFKTDDLSILNQEKMQIATVTVDVSEEYPGGELDCMLSLLPYEWSFIESEDLMQYMIGSPIAIVNSDTFETEELAVGEGETGEIFFVGGHMTKEPPQPTWQERLEAWAIEQALKILTFFQGINDVLVGLLSTL